MFIHVGIRKQITCAPDIEQRLGRTQANEFTFSAPTVSLGLQLCGFYFMATHYAEVQTCKITNEGRCLEIQSGHWDAPSSLPRRHNGLPHSVPQVRTQLQLNAVSPVPPPPSAERNRCKVSQPASDGLCMQLIHPIPHPRGAVMAL